MNQLTLDTFVSLHDIQKFQGQTLVLIIRNLNVAWTDRNWYLHSQDIVYLDERLASILVMRGMAKKLEVDNHASA